MLSVDPQEVDTPPRGHLQGYQGPCGAVRHQQLPVASYRQSCEIAPACRHNSRSPGKISGTRVPFCSRPDVTFSTVFTSGRKTTKNGVTTCTTPFPSVYLSLLPLRALARGSRKQRGPIPGVVDSSIIHAQRTPKHGQVRDGTCPCAPSWPYLAACTKAPGSGDGALLDLSVRMNIN